MDPYNVLFVCTGNICRSPMAECYFRHLCTENGYADAITADSAGVSTVSGYAASEMAVRLLESKGLSLESLALLFH